MDHRTAANAVIEVFSTVEKHYRKVGQVFAKGRPYCAVCVRGHVDQRFPLYATVLFGEVPEGEKTRCFQLAQEKAARLIKNPLHDSSWQTRDLEFQRYGGAIAIPSEERGAIGILSCSAFPELVDEAFMLAVAIHADLLPEREAYRIARMSASPLSEILDLMYKNQ